MPIKPENKDRYPDNWKEISERIRFERADNRCECMGECGFTHEHESHSGRCSAINYEPHPITGSKVILTVAHLDHTPEHCDDNNLKAMCQRCHLNYDFDIHRQSRLDNMRCKETKDMFCSGT